MKDLTLPKRFTIIALNGVRNTVYQSIRHLKDRCLVGAQIIEYILDGTITKSGENYVLTEGAGDENFRRIVSAWGRREAGFADWMKMAESLGKKECRKFEENIVAELKEEGLFDDIPALISCDLNYVSAGISVREYRSSPEQYQGEVDLLRAEFLDQDEPSDKAAALLWLLLQSGDLKYIFAGEELGQLQTMKNQMYREDPLCHDMFETEIGSGITKIWNSFLKKKGDSPDSGWSGSGVQSSGSADG